MLASGSGLPVLEDLELRAAHYPFARIASATLKKLAVERCGGGGDDDGDDGDDDGGNDDGGNDDDIAGSWTMEATWE